MTVGFSLGQDGKVNSDVRQVAATGGDAAATKIAYDAARRAILRCQGTGGYDLPAEKYSEWQDVEITFDPSGMRIALSGERSPVGRSKTDAHLIVWQQQANGRKALRVRTRVMKNRFMIAALAAVLALGIAAAPVLAQNGPLRHDHHRRRDRADALCGADLHRRKPRGRAAGERYQPGGGGRI